MFLALVDPHAALVVLAFRAGYLASNPFLFTLAVANAIVTLIHRCGIPWIETFEQDLQRRHPLQPQQIPPDLDLHNLQNPFERVAGRVLTMDSVVCSLSYYCT